MDYVVEVLFLTPARYGEVIVSQVKKVENVPCVYLQRLQTGKSGEVRALVRTEWLKEKDTADKTQDREQVYLL